MLDDPVRVVFQNGVSLVENEVVHQKVQGGSDVISRGLLGLVQEALQTVPTNLAVGGEGQSLEGFLEVLLRARQDPTRYVGIGLADDSWSCAVAVE